MRRRRVTCEWCGYGLLGVKHVALMVDGRLDYGELDLCTRCLDELLAAVRQARDICNPWPALPPARSSSSS